MDWSKYRTMALVGAGFFILVGTYNAVVINSGSSISSTEVKFVKRLDEVNGVTVAGRQVAAATQWQKLSPPVNTTKVITAVESAPEVFTEAAVQEELSLSLVEVSNSGKWKDGLKNSQFYGTLATMNGIIEDLNVSLPNGEGVAISFSEMSGNVFEYDFNGDLYSGMMYQVDQNAYVVTLTNGPLEGTKLRFSKELPAEEQYQTQQYLAENNIEAGNFGLSEIRPEDMLHDSLPSQESYGVQAFNLDQSQEL